MVYIHNMKLKVILVSEAIRKSSKNEKLLGIYLSNKVRFDIYILIEKTWQMLTKRMLIDKMS